MPDNATDGRESQGRNPKRKTTCREYARKDWDDQTLFQYLAYMILPYDEKCGQHQGREKWSV
jgi:hypothetical protein